MAAQANALDRARQSFERRRWGEAYTALSAADREVPLKADDIERLAIAARLPRRLLEDAPDCVEPGYVLLPQALKAALEGESAAACLARPRESVSASATATSLRWAGTAKVGP